MVEKLDRFPFGQDPSTGLPYSAPDFAFQSKVLSEQGPVQKNSLGRRQIRNKSRNRLSPQDTFVEFGRNARPDIYRSRR